MKRVNCLSVNLKSCKCCGLNGDPLDIGRAFWSKALLADISARLVSPLRSIKVVDIGARR